VVFPDQVRPDNIQQGHLGDCYFLTCLAALANNPDRLSKLFKDTSTNAAGCYLMQLCVNGSWAEVMVDDYLPVKNGTD